MALSKREKSEVWLTRNFRERVQARVRKDAKFRRGLLSDAVEALLAGEAALGREILRDVINATLGFPALAEKTGIHVKTLHQMFGPKGNPTAANLFKVFVCRSMKGCGCGWWRKVKWIPGLKSETWGTRICDSPDLRHAPCSPSTSIPHFQTSRDFKSRDIRWLRHVVLTLPSECVSLNRWVPRSRVWALGAARFFIILRAK